MNPSRSILATLFVALLLVGCSEESMLTGPDVDQQTSREAVTAVPFNSEPTIAMSKGGRTAICHVPPGQDETSAVLIEVGNAALSAHYDNHGDWEAPASGDCSETEDYGDWELWKTDIENAFPSIETFQEPYGGMNVSGPGYGFYVTWNSGEVRIDLPGIGFQIFSGENIIEDMAKYLGANLPHDPYLTWGGA